MMDSYNGVLRAAAIFGCALLAGCGGGGGGGGSTSPPPPPPPQNLAPTFGTVQFSTTEEVDVSGQVTATDPESDALTFTKTGNPSKGTVTAFATNGSFTYRPNHDAFGTDTFAVRVADSHNNATTGTVTVQIAGVNDPPFTLADTLSVSGAGIASVNVLANDGDVDGDALTVTIESAAEVGTATVNADNTIAISGLPTGFRGVTRFWYKITDPSNTSAIAPAAVFVNMAPFRVVFPADEPGRVAPEVFITDLASPPVQVSQATEGSLRLRGMLASANGSTVAYRRLDLAAGNAPADFSFVRTGDPLTQVRVQFPAGMVMQPVTGGGIDLYTVSPDGQWIAGVATKQPAGTWAIFLVNVADPTNMHTASPADTTAVLDGALQFSGDSQHLYYIARVTSDNNVLSLYRTAVATPDQSELMSAQRTLASADEVMSFAVSPDGSKILIRAGLSGDTLNMYYVSGASPRNEIRLSPQLDAGSMITGNSVRFGTANRLVYSISGTVPPIGNYVAELSATPNVRPTGYQGGTVLDLRPDGQAVLFQRGGPLGMVETPTDSAQETLVGDTEDYLSGLYDESGDALVGQAFHDPPPNVPLPNVGFITQWAAVRPTFGTTLHIGTPGTAALTTSFTGASRGIALIGEGPEVVPPAGVQTVRLAIASAWAPDKLLYLTDLVTSRTLKSSRGAIVDGATQ